MPPPLSLSLVLAPQERRATCSSGAIREQLPNFEADMATLLGHLLNLRNVPEGDRHRDERAACMIALLHFYGRIGRVEMKKVWRYVAERRQRWGATGSGSEGRTETEKETTRGFRLLAGGGVVVHVGNVVACQRTLCLCLCLLPQCL